MELAVRQTFGRYVAVDSPLHRLGSLAKVATFVLLVVSVFASAGWAPLACVAAYVCVLCLASRVRLTFYLQSMKYFAWMFALSFAINSVFPREGLAEALSPEALSLAGIFSARLALMIVGATVFTVVTNPSEIGDAVLPLSRLRGGLGRRAAEFASLVSISLRFVPVMFEEAERIKAARMLRGERARGLRGRLKLVAGLVVPLIDSSLRRATNLGYALEARCYGYATPASPGLKVGRTDVACGASAVGLLALVIWLR